MIRVYLAAKYGRQAEMREYRRDLQAIGWEVTSSWLDATDRDDPEDIRARRPIAIRNLDDVQRAHVLFAFTEHHGAPGAARGGRHVEFGYALALGKLIVTVGDVGRENLFHCHPAVIVVSSLGLGIQRAEEELRSRYGGILP